MTDLVSIRRSCRKARRALSKSNQRENSLSCARLIRKLGKLQRTRKIAVYLARDGELNLAPLLFTLQRIGKTLYLPILRPPPQRKLWFARYSPPTPLHLNRFSIPEPKISQRDKRSVRFLDVVLVPIVAFDAKCQRLGMGGGFYDKTFAYQSIPRRWRHPHLIGVAHECQRVAALPTRHWDVPMNMIVTEAKIYTNT